MKTLFISSTLCFTGVASMAENNTPGSNAYQKEIILHLSDRCIKNQPVSNTTYTFPNLITSAAGVILSSFDAVKSSKGVTCTWATAEEINCSHFELERSFDAKEFSTAAIIFSAEENSTATLNYKVTDADNRLRMNDIVYYRLKQLNKNGDANYSKVLTVELSKKETSYLQVAPNPFVKSVTYKVESPENGFVITKIFSLNGRVLKTTHTAVNKGSNQLNIEETNELPRGVYMLQVMLKGIVLGKQKIVKE